jgi:transposase-like protein
MARRKRRKFNPEFKAEAVRLACVGDRSIQQIATDLDLTESALRNWLHQAEIDAGQPRRVRVEISNRGVCRIVRVSAAAGGRSFCCVVPSAARATSAETAEFGSAWPVANL